MKRFLFVILTIAITGCSVLPESLAFLRSPTPAPTFTPEPTVTLIVRGPTDTPDLFVINSPEPTTTPYTETPLITDTPRPTFTPTTRPTITLKPLDPSLFTPSPNLFLSVQRSTSQIVWGGNCEGARNIQFIVQVAAVRRLRYVLLFYRLQDKYSGRGTEWGGGAIMSTNKQGAYFYTLELDQIRDYRKFEDAWLQYQFVGSTAGLTVLGRSVVDRTSVSITNCRALTP